MGLGVFSKVKGLEVVFTVLVKIRLHLGNETIWTIFMKHGKKNYHFLEGNAILHIVILDI